MTDVVRYISCDVHFEQVALDLSLYLLVFMQTSVAPQPQKERIAFCEEAYGQVVRDRAVSVAGVPLRLPAILLVVYCLLMSSV